MIPVAYRVGYSIQTRKISLKDMGVLQELIKDPNFLKASIELSKDDGRSLKDKVNDLMTKNPELVAKMNDPEMQASLQKLMENETIRKQVQPQIEKFAEELKKSN